MTEKQRTLMSTSPNLKQRVQGLSSTWRRKSSSRSCSQSLGYSKGQGSLRGHDNAIRKPQARSPTLNKHVLLACYWDRVWGPCPIFWLWLQSCQAYFMPVIPQPYSTLNPKPETLGPDINSLRKPPCHARWMCIPVLFAQCDPRLQTCFT